jgi:hypothetical protein
MKSTREVNIRVLFSYLLFTSEKCGHGPQFYFFFSLSIASVAPAPNASALTAAMAMISQSGIALDVSLLSAGCASCVSAETEGVVDITGVAAGGVV